MYARTTDCVFSSGRGDDGVSAVLTIDAVKCFRREYIHHISQRVVLLLLPPAVSMSDEGLLDVT